MAGIVIALDQWTKQLAVDRLSDGPYDLIPGWVTLRLTLNPGGAFGLGRDLTWLFLAATVAIVVVVMVAARQVTRASVAVPLGLVVGGGMGNAADRLLRDFDGRVVDMVDLHWWPVFNVADVAIVVGAAVLLITSRAES